MCDHALRAQEAARRGQELLRCRDDSPVQAAASHGSIDVAEGNEARRLHAIDGQCDDESLWVDASTGRSLASSVGTLLVFLLLRTAVVLAHS